MLIANLFGFYQHLLLAAVDSNAIHYTP